MGELNPAYQHNGKYSAWSKNFVNRYNKEKHDLNKQKQSKFMQGEGKKQMYLI